MVATAQELDDTLFQDQNFDEKVQRFATDAGCQVVYITKERFLDAENGAQQLRYGLTNRHPSQHHHLPATPAPYAPS